MSVPRLAVTKALRAALEAGTGKPCGWGRLPTLPDGSPAPPPYTVLSLAGAAHTAGSPLVDRTGDVAELLYQVTSVGGTRADQAEWMADRAEDVLLGQTASGFRHPIVVPGARVLARRLADDVGGRTEGGIVSHVTRYILTVTGA